MTKYNNIYLIVLLPFTLLFGGCGIYTDYRRPESLPIDSLYRDMPAALQDSAYLSDLPWRELLSDSLMVKLVNVAMENNYDLHTARLRTEEAQATLQASRLSFFPSLSLRVSGNLDKSDGSVLKSYSPGLSTEWEADVFGSLRNAKKSSLAALEASRAYEQAVQTQLIATVAQSYCLLLALDRKLAITKETALHWGESVHALEALKRAGESNEAAVAQSKASWLEAEASAVSLERQIHELENSISTLAGVAPHEVERGCLEDLSFPEELSTGVPVQLLSRRPDVRQKEWELAQAFYAANKARSAFYPKITLSGSAGWTSSGGSIPDPEEWILGAVGSLFQPIFNRGSNVAGLKIAKARQEEALAAFCQQLLDAGAEVNNALNQCESARRRLDIDRCKVDALESAVRSTELLMEHGTTNYLEVLTARQTLLQARLAEVDDIYDGAEGVISLYHALGGGTF
ncbi:MAG: efflux transporter outer membrane subunit [Candidatus Cryptobacteroides sp.]